MEVAASGQAVERGRTGKA